MASLHHPPSQRVVELFAVAESTAERLMTIVEEEKTLRDRLAELWREKTALVASLADECRQASVTEIEETLKRQLKAMTPNRNLSSDLP